MTTRLLAVALVACLALAAASLTIAYEPAYDAWAWLVWGRELAGLGLDTSSGPSWKPLPVALAALLSFAGDAAPALWLVVVRGAWLFSLVLAGGLAHRLTTDLDRRSRAAAAALAAVALLLLADEITAWPRQGAIGMSEPLLVALVLGAVAAALAGRMRLALGLAGVAALVRPEVWPLLAAYGAWRWRAQPALRPWIVALAVAVAALWVGPDLLAAGGASAAERALRGDDGAWQALLEVLGRAATMPLAVVWPLALVAVLSAATARRIAARAARVARATRERAVPVPASGASAERASSDRALLVLGAGTFAWIVTVALMAAAGFPGLPRFMAPAAAIAGVLAGAGLARALAWGRRPPLAALLVVALLVTAAQLPGRAAELPDALSTTAAGARSHDRLRALAREVGRGPLLRCGKLATTGTLARTALAWAIDASLSQVVSFGAPPTLSGVFVVGPGSTARVRAYMPEHAVLLGRRGEWRVYSLDCPAATTAAGAG